MNNEEFEKQLKKIIQKNKIRHIRKLFREEYKKNAYAYRRRICPAQSKQQK
jgi:hypothetical protein